MFVGAAYSAQMGRGMPSLPSDLARTTAIDYELPIPGVLPQFIDCHPPALPRTDCAEISACSQLQQVPFKT